MPSKLDKGSVTGEPVAYYAASPLKEAAKFVQNTARRFLAEKAGAKDLDEAIAVWNSEREKGATR
jgi:hypothetical protein